jgi:deoxyribodipyrimidine photo-lyase
MGGPFLQTFTGDPRVTVRRDGKPAPDGQVVVYWMERAQRAVDNPALDVAITVANELHQPVVVFLAPTFLSPTTNLRHYQFFFEGLVELEPALHLRRVGLVFQHHSYHRVVSFCQEVRASFVVGDENPLRDATQFRASVAKELRVPFWTVDADVIVPTQLLQKEQYAARTIRPRLQKRLPEFLVRCPEPKARVKWKQPTNLQQITISPTLPEGFQVDRSIQPVQTLRGGTSAARAILRRFIKQRLVRYSYGHRHPELDATSQLSPYLHFGHLGPREVALSVSEANHAPSGDRDTFLEQLIIRRELAINFVHYNPDYDRIESCEPWARRTLDEHRLDARMPHYGIQEFENAETHDPLWNAAQRQMVDSGWMHGYLRMYWAKKILEWSPTPEEAFSIAILLNDRYELDGRDPNGYAGIAWAVGGKHDRAWGPIRPVYGKVRYMSYESTRRKFSSKSYIQRWNSST